MKLGESQYGSSSGSGGSTTCPSQAPATLLAAQAARDDLFQKVAAKVGADPKDAGRSSRARSSIPRRNKAWAWKEFCARLGMDEAEGRRGNGARRLSNEAGNEHISSGQVGGVQVAEVAVDTETGVVRCTHMVAVQDCGLVVNKLACESQVAGGVIMGVNYALFEERIMRPAHRPAGQPGHGVLQARRHRGHAEDHRPHDGHAGARRHRHRRAADHLDRRRRRQRRLQRHRRARSDHSL